MAHTSNDTPEIEATIQAVRDAFELKEKGGLSEDEYAEVKGRLFSRPMPTPASTEASNLLEKTNSQVQATIDFYAGDLHRMMVRAIQRSRPGPDADMRTSMMETASRLLQLGGLASQDLPQLTKIIDTVSDKTFNNNMHEGLARINEAYNELKLNRQASGLAKTLAGIAYESAVNAVVGTPGTPDSQVAGGTPNRKPGFWSTVGKDFGGALAGATGIVEILHLGALHAASAALAAALGPAAAIPVVAGLVAVVVGASESA